MSQSLTTAPSPLDLKEFLPTPWAPDLARSYGATINACGKAAQWSQAMDLLADMESGAVQGNVDPSSARDGIAAPSSCVNPC